MAQAFAGHKMDMLRLHCQLKVEKGLAEMT